MGKKKQARKGGISLNIRAEAGRTQIQAQPGPHNQMKEREKEVSDKEKTGMLEGKKAYTISMHRHQDDRRLCTTITP